MSNKDTDKEELYQPVFKIVEKPLAQMQNAESMGRGTVNCKSMPGQPSTLFLQHSRTERLPSQYLQTVNTDDNNVRLQVEVDADANDK